MLDKSEPRKQPPRLSTEIWKVTLLMLKFVLGLGAFVFTILYLLRNHVLIAVCVIYGVILLGIIGFMGYQSYKWKKRQFERDRDFEERMRQARQVN